MVHFHNGIVHSRKKEGAPTLCGSMDGSGEHYAKRNKPGGERQIPSELTYKWNLTNKTKSKQNITRDTEIKNKLPVTRRQVRGDNGREMVERLSRNMYRGHMDNVNGR